MKSNFSELQALYLEDISKYLQKKTDVLYSDNYDELREIFYYHLGLRDPISKQGKRIRPLLALICSTGAGIQYEKAMPAAAAIEFIHNFSLIHDDIEDNGIIRRGKEVVWKKWGLAQGLNAGDAMFNAAFFTLQDLQSNFPLNIYSEAMKLIIGTCSLLTKGQFLDIGFEKKQNVSIPEYLEMVEGKTAALLACSTEVGAILAGLNKEQRSYYREFGHALGIAFQIYDDWLGIWGEENKLGKSTSSDLIEKKKSLPIIMGVSTSDRFRKKFKEPVISKEDASMLSVWLREDGIESKVIASFTEWSQRAKGFLKKMDCAELEKIYLEGIADKLLIRSK